MATPAASRADGASDLQKYPLDPPDISSPEATLNTFLAEAGAAVRAYYVGDTEELAARADRAFQTLDIDRPKNDAEFVKSAESALYLLEILSRIPLPPPSRIPGPDLEPAEDLKHWTVPHTELRLRRVDTESGDLIGYRFSADTIARLTEFYQRAKDLPVQPQMAKYEGVAERFRLRPGFTAPDFVQNIVQDLPPGWFGMFGGEPWWKWIALALTVIGAFLLFLAIYRLATLFDRRSRLHGWIRPLLAVVVVGLFGFAREVAVDWIRLTGFEREIVIGAFSIFMHLAVIWLVFLIAAGIANAVIRVRDMGVYALDAQLVHLVSKLAAVALSLYVLVDLAESLGIPVAPVLAGLGVGGLAVALAVRPTLENIVGGFVLFADAPVRVGEFCRFGDKLGTIEAIGLRSVRIRGLDRTVITVPNAEFSQLQLVNFTRRDAILLHTTLQLRYETTPDQLRLVLTKLRELLLMHPRVSSDPARVRFVGYGASSLDIEIFAFVQTRDFNEFLAIQEDVNLRIKDLVESSGSGFAFPSQTLYVEQSEGLDPELTKAAEDEVARWREENQLPFPNHEESVRSDLSGTLDYPPKGSPNT
ncbi:MAG: mechanosensitive ion channel domain-containing protein [Polyangiales bacterium]